MIWVALLLLVLPTRLAALIAVAIAAALAMHPMLMARLAPERSGWYADPETIRRASPIVAGMVLAGCLAMGVSWQPGQGWEPDAAKLAIGGLLFFAGSGHYLRPARQAHVHLVVALMLMATEITGSFLGWAVPAAGGITLGLPSGNHAALLVCILSPIALSALRSPREELLYLAVLGIFGLAIFSRLAIGALILLLAQRFARHRVTQVAVFLGAAVAIALPRFRGFEFGSFSDQLRLRIWGFGIDRISNERLLIFGEGERTFLETLNEEPLYRTLEVSHAHNLVLHLWNSYGMVVALLWAAALLWLVRSLWGTSSPVNTQLVALLMIAQLETIVSDVRILCVVMLMLGLRFRSVVGPAPEEHGTESVSPPDSPRQRAAPLR